MLQDILKEFEERFGRKYEVESEPNNYIHEGLNHTEFLSHAKDFITHTYNTAIKEHNLNCKQGIQAVEIMNIQKEARKELIEEILSEMPKAYRTESYITEQPITQDEKSYGEGMNDFREIIINLLNKKI